jgi:heme/copper-type cytochrome/quinol oxidase subunit 4
MNSEFPPRRVVASLSNEIEASIIAEALERTGIHCWMSGTHVAGLAIPIPSNVTITVESSEASRALDVIQRAGGEQRSRSSDATSHRSMWSSICVATEISALRAGRLLYRKMRAWAAIPRFRIAGVLLLQVVVALSLFAWVGQKEIVEIVMTFVSGLILVTIAAGAVWIVLNPSRARHRIGQYSPLIVAVAAIAIALRFFYLVIFLRW